MTESPVRRADPSVPGAVRDDAGGAGGNAAPDQAPGSKAVEAEEVEGAEGAEEVEELAFGDHTPSRVAADVEYRGRAEGHDYLVRVRHRFLDTSFTVVIDGVEHDPKAEEKARKEAEKTAEREKSDKSAGTEAASSDDANSMNATSKDARSTEAHLEGSHSTDAHSDGASGGTASADELQFRLEENFTALYCTVRRPDDDGDLKDAEVLTVRTAGFGGAGEVDVRHGLERSLLIPAEGSPSAARDLKRIAHPARYALIAALAKAAGFLIPLLGFGALFSGLLDPVKEWIGSRIRSVLDAIAGVTEPIRQWIAELLRPVQEFLDALFAPVREFFAALLRPVGDAWNWLMNLLFGWIPDLSLPFSVPEWVIDVSVPVVVVLVVFIVTFSGLRRRQAKLEATRVATVGGSDEATTTSDGGPGADPRKQSSESEERPSTAEQARSKSAEGEMASLRTAEHASSPE